MQTARPWIREVSTIAAPDRRGTPRTAVARLRRGGPSGTLASTAGSSHRAETAEESGTVSSQTPLDDDLRGATLLERLKGWKGHHSEFNSLLFISFAILPVGEASAELWRDLQAVLIRFRSKYEGVLYRLSLPDRAVLVNINEYNQVGMITDLKVELLRMIQQYFPPLLSGKIQTMTV